MSGPAALLAYDPGRNPETVSAAQHAQLRELLDVLLPEPVRRFDDPALAPLLPEVEVLVTGWGAPRLDRAALEAMPRLRLVAHLAGTVKGHLAPETWERGIRVVNAADANALPVANTRWRRSSSPTSRSSASTGCTGNGAMRRSPGATSRRAWAITASRSASSVPPGSGGG